MDRATQVLRVMENHLVTHTLRLKKGFGSTRCISNILGCLKFRDTIYYFVIWNNPR